MRHSRVIISFLLLCLVLSATPLLAQAAGRVVGEVVDPEGNAIRGVTVTITTPSIGTYREELKTNKKGRFTAVFVDATRTYDFRLEKEGFQPYEEAGVKPTIGDIIRKTFTLYPVGATTPAPSQQGAASAPTSGIGLTDAEKRFNEGVQAAQAGDRATAMAKWEEAVELDPELVPAHQALANAYLRTDQPDKAVTEAERVLELEPDDIGALEILFDAHSVLGNDEEAEQYLAQLTEGGAGNLAPRYFNAAVAALNAGQYEAAAEKFRKALEFDPNLVDAHSALSVALIRQEKYEESLAAAEKTLELDPANARARRMRYQALRFLGRDEEAATAFEDLDPADRRQAMNIQYNQASKLFEAGQTGDARTLLEDILAADPEHPQANYMMGLILTSAGEAEKALEHFRTFVELAPDDPEAPTARQMIQHLEGG